MQGHPNIVDLNFEEFISLSEKLIKAIHTAPLAPIKCTCVQRIILISVGARMGPGLRLKNPWLKEIEWP